LTPAANNGNNIRLRTPESELEGKNLYICFLYYPAGVVDTGGNLPPVSKTQGDLVAKFAAGVVDTGGKFDLVHPQNVRFQKVRFQNVWFQNVRFQNVRFTKRQVYKTSGFKMSGFKTSSF
jgi:hypothetical protein